MNPAVRCRESLSQFRNDLCCSHLGLAQLLSLAQLRALQTFFVRICAVAFGLSLNDCELGVARASNCCVLQSLASRY